MKAQVAALYVREDGPYPSRVQVYYNEERDARRYPGDFPVIAHPPCARWGRYWFGGPSVKVRKQKGDDGGCFAHALDDVRKWGGVLEHPEASHAWGHFGLNKPPHYGGWIEADDFGLTCCVDQGHYGHMAQKKTWLYLVGVDKPPALIWGEAPRKQRPWDKDLSLLSDEERARAVKTGVCQRLSHRQRELTPEPFADLLVSLASMVGA